MAHNAAFWGKHFQRAYAPQLAAVVDVLEERLLPQFDGIEGEAERKRDEAWESLTSQACPDEVDGGQLAEAAQEIGVEHYLLLRGMRQAMLNLVAAGLYHAWEQQLVEFHRRELLAPHEEDELALANVEEAKKRLRRVSVDVEAFKAWREVDEARLVANAVKHASGSSAHKLAKLRPELFRDPSWPAGAPAPYRAERVFRPLAGEDIFVTLEDVRRYRDALMGFWEELAEALAAA